MSDDYNKAEAGLRKLGARFRRGLSKLHPPPERAMEAVRQIVSKQSEQERQVANQIAQAKAKMEAAQSETSKQEEKDRENKAKERGKQQSTTPKSQDRDR